MLRFNPTRMILQSWIDWFLENDLNKIQLIADVSKCDAPGFDDYNPNEPIVWNIHASAVRYLHLEDDHLEFETTRRRIPTVVRVPYSAILILKGVDRFSEEPVLVPASAFVYDIIPKEDVDKKPVYVDTAPVEPKPTSRPTLTVVK